MQLTARHLAFSASFAVLLALLGSAIAVYNPALPGHPLDQVFTCPGGGTACLPTARAGADANTDNKVDAANTADNALNLGGAPASNFIQRTCVTLNDENNNPVTTPASGTNVYRRVVIPTGLCTASSCTIVLRTSTGSTKTVALATYKQESDGTWGAIVGGAIGGAGVLTDNGGTNGGGASKRILRDGGSSSALWLYDDAPTGSGSGSPPSESVANEWTLRDSWSGQVDSIQLCSS